MKIIGTARLLYPKMAQEESPILPISDAARGVDERKHGASCPETGF
jgi:hypothetical protein